MQYYIMQRRSCSVKFCSAVGMSSAVPDTFHCNATRRRRITLNCNEV
uniref:Uncharacterized protein n=1 Tax=Anguilla anguilla TaxID=7936 RepID=A0A0E9W7E6_ANGAN